MEAIYEVILIFQILIKLTKFIYNKDLENFHFRIFLLKFNIYTTYKIVYIKKKINN